MPLSSFRPVIAGRRHMAVAGHYLASHAAFAILEGGGNATDAGVAAGIALGVVQCDLVNFAGVAPIMYRDAQTGAVSTISGLGTWPKKADAEFLRRAHGGAIPEGVLRSVVPGAPDAWITALEQWGTISFGEAAAAAIRFAQGGFVVYPLLAEIIALNRESYARWPSNEAIFLPGGRPPQIGDVLRQADLAATLRYMADEERSKGLGSRAAGLAAARDAFYRGDIAARIGTFYRAEEGWLTAEDLASFRVERGRAVEARFGDGSLFVCGPWCQGPVLAQMAGLLDLRALHAAGHNSVDYIHVFAEAMKLAFADREHWYGDPNFVDVPVEALLSRRYAELRRSVVDPTAAMIAPPPGDPIAPAARIPARPGSGHPARPATPRDTSYVCVVDRWGNAFSATPSDVSYDVPVVPGTGLCVSSRGSQSWTLADHPSCLAPGKRPRLTPNPAMAVTADGHIVPFGTPGGDVQAQAMLQTLLNVTLFGMDPQQAVEAPRFATYDFPDSFEPHGRLPGRLTLEGRIPESVGADLRSRGHDIAWWPDWTWKAGAVCMIDADPVRGVLSAGADPRRPAYALGG
jgi:gamma-glutamyltranspeptidase / glutathione hydrolase